jgi:hypothetical protein
LIGAVSGPVILAILFIFFTATYIYFGEIWRTMIRNPERYQEWNRLRKEWNKVAAMERRRRYIMACILDDEVRKQGLSQEDKFHYAGLVRDLHALKDIKG